MHQANSYTHVSVPVSVTVNDGHRALLPPKADTSDLEFYFAAHAVEIELDDSYGDDADQLAFWDRVSAAYDRHGLRSDTLCAPGTVPGELVRLQLRAENRERRKRFGIIKRRMGAAAANEYWRSAPCWWMRYERGRLQAEMFKSGSVH
jgi:hypothetical protein